jgi:putative tricarboxylic transport membrane protein
VREKAGEIVAAIVLLAFAGAMLGITFGFPGPIQAGDPGVATLPRIVATGLGILAVFVLLRPEAGEPLPRGWAALRVAGILVLLFAYAALLEPLGFTLASILFLLGALLLAGARKPVYLIIIPPGLSLALFYMFYAWLEVALPRGLIESVLF